jgi:hypothetical protein
MEGSLVAYKVFTNGSVLQASEINDNLMRQSVMVFSNAAARTAAITSPLEGMLTWLEDVNRYESYNGTAWVSPFGSTLLGSSSFTTQASIAFDNIFTADYVFYDAYVTVTGTGADTVAARLRTGSTDLSSSTYLTQVLQNQNAVVSSFATAGTSFYIGTHRTAGRGFWAGSIANPFLAQETQISFNGWDNTTRGENSTGRNSSAVSYNGIRFFTNTGTLTGNIAIYGRRA